MGVLVLRGSGRGPIPAATVRLVWALCTAATSRTSSGSLTILVSGTDYVKGGVEACWRPPGPGSSGPAGNWRRARRGRVYRM
jgi:hypothetical protein